MKIRKQKYATRRKELKGSKSEVKSSDVVYLQTNDGLLLTPREFWEQRLIETLRNILAGIGDEDLLRDVHEYMEIPGAAFVLMMRGDGSLWEGFLNIERPKPTKLAADLLHQSAEIVNLPKETPKEV